ncbi:MAG: methyl-accepting chemotaxis protein [Salinibacter sp.]
MCPYDQEATADDQASRSAEQEVSRSLDDASREEREGTPLTTRLRWTFGGTGLLSAAAVAGACIAGSAWTAAGVLLVGGLLAAALSAHVARTVGQAEDRSEETRPEQAHSATGEEGERMQALTQLMNRTSGEEELEAAFRTFLQQVREVTDAKYAALSIFGDDGEIAEFFTLGLTEGQREQIGGLPEGEGLLGHIHEKQEMLHLDDMSRHSESVGFPDGHPPMQSLLAAPITYQGRPLGNLYLSDKRDVITFSDADAQFVESASEAAAVLINEKESRLENQRMRQRLRHETEAIASVLDRLADGDLSVDIPQDSDDEDIARVWDRLHETVDTLRGLLRQVAGASREMSRASDEISATADEISAGAEEQSAQTEEVASAMEEMSRTIHENAETIEGISQRAEHTERAARDNGAVIYETIEKMERIGTFVERSTDTIGQLNESSEEIGTIVTTIEEIADQTNLLALNAAIEAARAGEHGDGFAVVAEEVRDLAEQTAEATERIDEVITAVQEQTQSAVQAMRNGHDEVQEGIELADQAGGALDDMISNIQQVAGAIEEIAAATEEQSTTSEQVSQSINEISTVTAENARGVTEIAQSTSDLSGLSDRLVETVDQFTLEADEDPASHSQHDRAQHEAERPAAGPVSPHST